MAILRHSRIALTIEIYTQVPDKVTRDALRRLSDQLDSDQADDDELGAVGPASLASSSAYPAGCCTGCCTGHREGRLLDSNRPSTWARSEGLEPPTF
jgi:hypothetical protein